MLTKRDLLRSAALAAITATTTKAVPASAQAKAEWPSLFEAKAIAVTETQINAQMSELMAQAIAQVKAGI